MRRQCVGVCVCLKRKKRLVLRKSPSDGSGCLPLFERQGIHSSCIVACTAACYGGDILLYEYYFQVPIVIRHHEIDR